MRLFTGALRTGIAVKVIDVVRREARKPENQRKARQMLDRVRREVSKPENQRKAKEMLAKVTNRGSGKTRF